MYYFRRATLKIHRRTETYHFDDLRQFQTHFDRQPVRVVAYGSDESVVVAQQIVVKSFGVGTSVHGSVRHGQLTDNDRGEYGANDFHRWKKFNIDIYRSLLLLLLFFIILSHYNTIILH